MEIRSNADLSDFQSKLKAQLSYRNYVMSIFSPVIKLDELLKDLKFINWRLRTRQHCAGEI